MFVHLNNNPSKPIIHVMATFSTYGGCIMGADVDMPVVISGMVICVVLPSREVIEEICIKLAEGGTLIQEFVPYPAPHENDGGAEVLNKFGYT